MNDNQRLTAQRDLTSPLRFKFTDEHSASFGFQPESAWDSLSLADAFKPNLTRQLFIRTGWIDQACIANLPGVVRERKSFCELDLWCLPNGNIKNIAAAQRNSHRKRGPIPWRAIPIDRGSENLRGRLLVIEEGEQGNAKN